MGDPTEVPVAFVSPTDGWGVVGATDDLLVGLGGEAAEDADVFGQTFDLETGALADIPAPPFDDERPVQIDTAVFGTTKVIVDAYVYGHGVDADTVPVDSGYTPPTDLLSYRLDPVERTWARLTLPAGFEDVPQTSLWHIDPTGADSAAGYFRPSYEGAATLAVIDGDDDGWRTVAGDLPNGFGAEFCATDTTWWLLESEVTTASLLAVALADGRTRDVEIPPAVAAPMIGTRIACSAERVVLAAIGGRDSPPGLFVSREDGTWDVPPDPYDTGQGAFIEDVTSGGA
ncbi:MAG TPA: hypothetical protein VGO60_03375, partial [Iamia sp.]|nr:hypothetical protein [Iamia sp.]